MRLAAAFFVALVLHPARRALEARLPRHRWAAVPSPHLARVVLVSLVFWTWAWGPVGALLAVPMTVTLLAAAAHTPALAPLASLLTAERERGSA